jgi:cytochrome c oxidase assembly protein subunit 15
LLVIGQGVLGGMRVLFDARTLAMIHGCVGPLFFAYCVLLATLTSRRWQESSADRGVASGSSVAATSLLLTALAYAQLVLGAQLRHIGASVAPVTFRGVLFFHLIGAAALLLITLYLAARLHRDRSQDRWLRRPGIALGTLVLLQVGLGAGAWVVNYGWPAWLGEHAYTAQFVVRAKDSLQANITTAHVAVGSLILATAAMIALRSLRLARGGHWAPRLSFVRTEAAA